MSKRGDEGAWDFAEFQAGFTPNEMTAMVCSDGKLVAEIERLETELGTIDEAAGHDLARRIMDLHEELRGKERPFVFRALGDRAWSDLIAEHPPADDQELLGYNPDTFQQAAVSACCVGPPVSVEQADWLRSNLAAGQWRRLWVAARMVNEGPDGVGKEPSSIATRLATGPSSTTAAPEESPAPSS